MKTVICLLLLAVMGIACSSEPAIMEEYDRLVKAGYTNISLLGSSTSGALLLELVSSGYFANRLAPRTILLVDPYCCPLR